MSQFEYAPYRDAHSGTIADLMMAPAQAQARAAQASGEAWAGAATQIGQSVANLPKQIQQQQAQQQETDVRNFQLKELRDQAKSEAVFEAALKNPKNYNPDGSINDDAVGQSLRSQDVKAWQHWTAISTANKKNALETASAFATLQKTQMEIGDKQRAAQQIQQTYLGTLAYHALDVLNQQPGDLVHTRDTFTASIARAAADQMLDEKTAKATILQTAGASPDQLTQMMGSLVAPELKAKLDQEKATLAKTQADTAKTSAEANNLALLGPKRTATEAALDAYAKSIGKMRAEDLTDPERQAYAARDEARKSLTAFAQHQRERNYDVAHPIPDKAKSQDNLEQEYRTVLARGLSSRSGGLGLEDSKVQQANHLLALMEQSFDPKTGAYNIPKVQYEELALGLARLISPGGAVGEGMKNDLIQATAAGDLNKVATYLTGTPFNGSTQDVYRMLRDSIERQGKVALENREGEMRFLRGLAPTDLEEARRTKLEANSLNPLRQSRVIQNTATGERKIQVSTDGGASWK